MCIDGCQGVSYPPPNRFVFGPHPYFFRNWGKISPKYVALCMKLCAFHHLFIHLISIPQGPQDEVLCSPLLSHIFSIIYIHLVSRTELTLHNPEDPRSTTLRIRAPQPWGSALHNPEDPHSTTQKIWKRFYGSDDRE